MYIDDTTPIAALTVADLKTLILSIKEDKPVNTTSPANKRYVYGLQGIQELFNCSHATAQQYKNTFLQDAIIQNGRKIIVDVEHALQLFAQKNEQ